MHEFMGNESKPVQIVAEQSVWRQSDSRGLINFKVVLWLICHTHSGAGTQRLIQFDVSNELVADGRDPSLKGPGHRGKVVGSGVVHIGRKPYACRCTSRIVLRDNNAIGVD